MAIRGKTVRDREATPDQRRPGTVLDPLRRSCEALTEPIGGTVSIVAGVDFGTQSVRVSIFDSETGLLGSGTGAYPVHRRGDDPEHASQSHADQMAALVGAMRLAIE